MFFKVYYVFIQDKKQNLSKEIIKDLYIVIFFTRYYFKKNKNYHFYIYFYRKISYFKEKGICIKHFYKLKFTLCTNYLIYAIILTTLGIVISQSIEYFNISIQESSFLEIYKDLSVIIIAVFLGPYLPKIGYKKALAGALILVGVSSLFVAFIKKFWIYKLLFSISGGAFAIIMIVIYSLAGIIEKSKKGHLQFLNFAEGSFIFGAIIGPLIFALMTKLFSWTSSYIIIGILVGLSFLNISFTSFPKIPMVKAKFKFLNIGKIVKKQYLILILFIIFLTTVVDINFLNWIPSFNKEILFLTSKQSMLALSLFAVFFATGRFITAYLLKFMSWFNILIFCMVASIISISTVLVLTSFSGFNKQSVHVLSYVFSLSGLFVGPMLPTISSIFLNTLHEKFHHLLTIMIIITLAIASSSGTLLIAGLSKIISFHNSFYSLLLIQVFLIVLIIILKTKFSYYYNGKRQ